MINRNKFFEQMERLQQVYSPLTDIALDEYYMALKFFDLSEIKEAVDYFCRDESYGGQFTPKPPEIVGVINEIRRNRSYQMPGDEIPAPECPECHSTHAAFVTWINPITGYLTARGCTHCERGRRITLGRNKYLGRRYKRELITDDKSSEKYGDAVNEAMGGNG